MRSVLFSLLMSIVLAGFAQAEPQDIPNSRLHTYGSKTDVKKFKPVRVPTNPCAQFGSGFVRVEGSDTCVKIGGSIAIGVGGSSGMTMPR